MPRDPDNGLQEDDGSTPRGGDKIRGRMEHTEYSDSLDEVDLAPEEPPRFTGLGATPFWAISALLHLLLLLIFANIFFVQSGSEEGPNEIRVRVIPAPPKYDPIARRDTRKRPDILAKRMKDPVILRKIPEIVAEIPKGTDLNNVTNFELDAHEANISIGVFGGAAGAYGERWGKGSLIREGGSRATEDAVRAALEWLRRHQSPDGSWKAREYVKRCKTTCKNENPRLYGDGRGVAEYDVGVTALAILAFTGYGHTHRFGAHPEYVACLRNAVAYMKRIQVRSENPRNHGRFGGEHRKWIYDHSMATLAMAELLLLSGDAITLKRSVKDAVELCLQSQNEGRGWRYGYRPGDDDTSVTGWMVLALKTAKNARLGIPEERFHDAFRGALRFMRDATDKRGVTGYRRAGERDNSSGGWPGGVRFSKDISCMTSVSVLCRIFAGESRSNRSIRSGAEVLLREPPSWKGAKGRSPSLINFYYWYYGSYALFQFGGKEWEKWNPRMQRALLSSQRRGNVCEDGSWDSMGEWANHGGRVYSTALGAMTLEVYYRYRRAQEGRGW